MERQGEPKASKTSGTRPDDLPKIAGGGSTRSNSQTSYNENRASDENTNDLSLHAQALVAGINEIKSKNPELFQKTFTIELPILSYPVLNKIGWWIFKSDPTIFNILKLKFLFDFLLASQFIKCSYDEFEVHFIGDGIPDGEIKWFGDITVLALLFYQLQAKGIIPKTAVKWDETLAAHFQSMNKRTKGNELDAQNLRSTLSKARQSQAYNTVKNLIQQLVL